MTRPERILILGAGPVGLGAALELARFGVPSLVVEKRETTSWHPKTRNINTRTMEIARGWGEAVYRRLRSIDTPEGWKSPIRFLTSATGEEYGLIETKGFEGPGADISPALPIMSSQELLEEILLDAARATGLIEFRFRHEATRLVQGGHPADSSVTLEVLDLANRRVEQINGSALVAADGAGSLIRSELGLDMEGPRGLSHVVNCYFRAEIEPLIADRKSVLMFVSNPRAQGVLQPLDGAGRWLCQIGVRPEDWSLEAFTKDRAREWVRAAVGVEDLEVDVVSLGLWKMNATVADQLVVGRVVMCGDAAHQFPPTGGLGVNTGLQGMHNVMWKLALCVKALAGWPLLGTYQDERRRLSQQIAAQSLTNSANVAKVHAAARSGRDSGLDPAEVASASRRYGNHLGVEFGAVYVSSAVIADGSEPPDVEDSYSDYTQSATPGARAPHVWIGRPEAQFSTLDLFGPGFTLLAARGGEAWMEQAAAAERVLGLRVYRYRMGSPGLQSNPRFEDLYRMGEAGAVLVRPDGHIGWRTAFPPTADGEVEAALRKIVSRPA